MSRQPRAEIPEWFEPARRRLIERRDDLHAQLDQAAEARRQAGLDLAALQPDLAAAHAAWAPYAAQIAEINEQLHERLKPAMWAAAHDERHAGIGRRRAARHRLADARRAVDDAEADIRAIETSGAPVKRHLDQLTAPSPHLREAADPDRPSTYLDNLNRLELTKVQGLLDALHTWQHWAEGHPVTPSDAHGRRRDDHRRHPPRPPHPADLDDMNARPVQRAPPTRERPRPRTCTPAATHRTRTRTLTEESRTPSPEQLHNGRSVRVVSARPAVGVHPETMSQPHSLVRRTIPDGARYGSNSSARRLLHFSSPT